MKNKFGVLIVGCGLSFAVPACAMERPPSPELDEDWPTSHASESEARQAGLNYIRARLRYVERQDLQEMTPAKLQNAFALLCEADRLTCLLGVRFGGGTTPNLGVYRALLKHEEQQNAVLRETIREEQRRRGKLQPAAPAQTVGEPHE